MMQFSPLRGHKATSPKVDRRGSTLFLNDYAESLQTNFAPAAYEADIEDCKKPFPKPRIEEKQSSTFLRPRKKTSRSISPGPMSRKESGSRSPVPMKNAAKEQPFQKEPQEWVPFPSFPRSLARKKGENTPPRQSRSKSKPRETAPSDFQTPVKEQKKKGGFLRLAEEKVPHEKRFRNRNTPSSSSRSGRTLKADYIKNKFGNMEISDNTIKTEEGTLGSFSGRSLPPLPDLNSHDDEQFVEGLVFFAPACEHKIREMSQSEMRPSL